MNETIDVLMTASSRPLLMPYCVESFKRFIFTGRKMRWILHEDFIFPEESKKVVNWAKDHFDEIHTTNPAQGLGKAFSNMIPKIKSKYLLYIQEDWILERPIDVDRIIWTMDNHNELNCITFHKYKIDTTSGGFRCDEYNFSGLELCVYNGWSFLPGVWRVSKFKEHWEKTGNVEVRPESVFNKTFPGRLTADKEWVQKNMGTYFYGKRGTPRFVCHQGYNWRMAKWQLVDGKPGGDVRDYDKNDKHRAPWVPRVATPKYDGRELK